jgi:hypothetical protein
MMGSTMTGPITTWIWIPMILAVTAATAITPDIMLKQKRLRA